MSWIGEFLLNIHNWMNGAAKIKSSITKTSAPVRIGVLGAAAINYAAIIDPIQTHPDATLVGIAARSKARAEAQIAKYNLTECKAYGSYDEILADQSVDAVYIPLPNGLHCEWAIKAMKAGKHVLIEKPIASNAEEVRKIKEDSERTGKIALEAYHPLFHPADQRLRTIIEGGKYGDVTSVEARFLIPSGALAVDDIRFQYGLAGGASMDLAYGYCACLYLRGGKDVSDWDFRILEAVPRLHPGEKKIDEAMESTFIMETPGKKTVQCKVHVDSRLPALWGFIPRIWDASPYVAVELEKARIELPAFVLPSYNHAITIREKNASGQLTGRKEMEKCYVGGDWQAGVGETWWTTYRYQLEAFVGAIRAQQSRADWKGPWVSLDFSTRIMEMVDALYEKAGLPQRGL